MDRQGKAWVISHHQTLSHCHTGTLSHRHTVTADWWQPRTCRTCRDLITQFIFIRTWPAVLPRNISQQASGDIRHHHHHHLHHHHYHQLLQVLCLSRRKYVSDDDLSILSNVTMIEHQIGLRCFYWGVNISRNIIGRQDWGAGPGAPLPLLSSPSPSRCISSVFNFAEDWTGKMIASYQLWSMSSSSPHVSPTGALDTGTTSLVTPGPDFIPSATLTPHLEVPSSNWW